MAGPAYIDAFRFIKIQPDGTTVTADAVNDTLTLVAGTGISLVANSSSDQITIVNSGSGASITLDDVLTQGNTSTQSITVGGITASGLQVPILSGDAIVLGDSLLNSGLKFVRARSSVGDHAWLAFGEQSLYNGQTNVEIMNNNGGAHFDIRSYSVTGGDGPTGNRVRLRVNSNGDTQIFGTESTSTTSGALQVTGGAGISGNLHVAGTTTFTGTVSGVTATMVGLGNVDNTADANKSVLYATTAGSAPASDVYAWAKETTKPTYTASEVGLGDVLTEWIDFTPTWTASTTNPVIGDGFIEGRYKKVGSTVHVWAKVNMGSTTTFGSGEYKLSLPVNGRALSSVVLNLVMRKEGIRLYNSLAHNAYTSSTSWDNANVTLFWDAGVVTDTAPFAWAYGDWFIVSGTYEATT